MIPINATNDTLQRRGFSVKEVARMHGFSDSFVRLEIARGHLRSFHVGRRVILTPEALDLWLEEGESRR